MSRINNNLAVLYNMYGLENYWKTGYGLFIDACKYLGIDEQDLQRSIDECETGIISSIVEYMTPKIPGCFNIVAPSKDEVDEDAEQKIFRLWMQNYKY